MAKNEVTTEDLAKMFGDEPPRIEAGPTMTTTTTASTTTTMVTSPSVDRIEAVRRVLQELAGDEEVVRRIALALAGEENLA